MIEASKVLDKALEKVTLKDINRSAVLRVQKILESRGETFKYDTSVLEKRVSKIIFWIN